MDAVFKALADESRRKLLDELHRNTGQTLTQLCGLLDMTRQTVSKHLALLESANLVVTVWRGREKLHFSVRCLCTRSTGAGSTSMALKATHSAKSSTPTPAPRPLPM